MGVIDKPELLSFDAERIDLEGGDKGAPIVPGYLVARFRREGILVHMRIPVFVIRQKPREEQQKG